MLHEKKKQKLTEQFHALERWNVAQSGRKILVLKLHLPSRDKRF